MIKIRRLLSAGTGFEREGFSLVEILVSLTIFSVMILVAGGVLHKVLIDWSRQRDYFDCVQNARASMSFMVNEVRNAKKNSVSVENSGASIRFLWAGQTSNSDRVWYWIGNQDDDGTSRGDKTILYRGTGTNLNSAYDERTELANFVANAEIGTDVFDRSGDEVTITLMLMPHPEQYEDCGYDCPGNHVFILSSKVRVRN
ncbi:MAG: prepilin-type N-terminal cleavage/methylation domain-containing protein [Candidatus Omnitrophica bacterium]|nr:prepilin-type N-terminal cleavage/methylation domain-containing protein [Candidatus Omnitrophota bacterium]